MKRNSARLTSPAAIIGVLCIASYVYAAGQCGAGACPVSPEAKGKEAVVANITTPVLKALIGSGVEVVILDARSGKYDDGNRIPGARALSPSATAEQAAGLIRSKETLVITYCANLQCPASDMLAKRLKELGYKNILEYPDGIQGWITEGNEVEKVK